ncbi:2Fe-2S iron-sulfur cluster-binding protein [Paeniglutamicibacter sp. ORCA_105]|uniref:2Fe-2S iron-sulfur cluster-binding protein n=1 Tax=Paeniglutamicibacter sp. ORCA_105 TaxID=3377336 RepID=UPI003895BE6F
MDCAADEFILDAVLAAGAPVPSSCTPGMRGACKFSLLGGTGEMNHAGGIRPREIAAGKVLICCSTPTGDLVIDA